MEQKGRLHFISDIRSTIYKLTLPNNIEFSASSYNSNLAHDTNGLLLAANMAPEL